jgi:RNA polymerase sigma-70 factor (ECF subfamily)
MTDLDPAGWVDRHGDYLYRYALRTVRRPEAAEDLVQDALLAAWRNRDGFRGQADERTWLTAVLKRKVIDWLRRTVRERAAAGPPPGDPADASFTARGKWATAPPRWPAADAERDEFWAVVRGCADRLPPRLREVFVLRHLDDQPADDVCRAAGVAPGNLWVMLHRARHGMWLCLGRNGFGQPPATGKAGER